MLLATLMALALWQDPAPAPAAAQPAAPGAAAPAAPAAPSTPRERRLANQRRHQGETVCENRAPTGSVMSRRLCRTERRVRTDAARAQAYVQEVTVGSVNEPHPDISAP
jgi:hypothetical protein